MKEIPRGYAHRPRLVALPPMSEMSSGPAAVKRHLTLTKSGIDRSAHLRISGDHLAKHWQSALIATVINGKFLTGSNATGSSTLLFRSAQEIDSEARDGIAVNGNQLPLTSGEKFFLGIDPTTNESFFAWCTSTQDRKALDEDSRFRSLRDIGALLSDRDGGIAVHTMGLANWHHSHPFCAKCGGQTRVEWGGAVRICSACESQHHPRTDAAVIVLVRDESDRILLGHQPSWPEHRFSTFAGFVEPGESFEQCVAREVAEECGVVVHSINYLASQPWPFPASLMIAFEATTSAPEAAKADGEEIAEVQWFSRQSMLDAIAAGKLLLPPQISVSRRMIEYWYGENALVDLAASEGKLP